jgi:transposase
VLVSLCYVLVRWLLEFVTLRARSKEFQELEIIVLRHELAILRRTTRRPAITGVDRLLLAIASRLLPRARWQSFIVTPATLRRWHRRWSRSDGPARVQSGCPPMRRETRDLALRLARENPLWGYQRIVGELKGLGITVSASTVREWLRAAGLGPAGKRGKTTWREFIRVHRQSILAVDFFTVETIWLQRLDVLFFIELGPACARGRLHAEPERAMGHSAGAASVVDGGGASGAAAVSDSRSGSEIHRYV